MHGQKNKCIGKIQWKKKSIFFLEERVKKFFKENIAPKLEEIGNHFSDLKDAFGKFGDAFGEVFEKVK